MKIVHVGFSHRPDDIRIFQKECLSLARHGHQVCYITANRNVKFENVTHKNMQVIIVDLHKTNRLIRFWIYCKDAKKILCSINADVYHFHEVNLLPLLTYMRRQKKRVIYDLHEDSPRQLQPLIYEKCGRIIGKLLVGVLDKYENYCIKKSDYVITATPYIEKRCKKITDKVECVANYPILVQEKNNRGDRGETDGGVAGTSLKRPVLCYCGGLSEDRNISMYVEMMKCIEGKLLLAGILNNCYRKQLERISSWNKVESLGYLDREGVKNLYKKSDIGLCILKYTPNIYYSLPIKLFEYMEAGLPIICSDFPIWREIVEGCDCGIVVPYDDMEKAIEAAQYILAQPDVAFRMGENGKRAVREKYNWQIEEKKLLAVYDRMISIG